MRIITWNVNGIKSLHQYHPFNLNKTYEALLDTLGADITCIQETKITVAQITRLMACMESYDSFFSSYRKNVRGIHGTAIFTKRSAVVPLKAEEGLSSILIPSTVETQERIGGYGNVTDLDLDYSEIKDLDSEGRTTICDFGLFVIINLYCPCETNEDRVPFKNNFNSMVNARARGLIEAGRQVIVLGDLNIIYKGIQEDSETEKTGRYSEYAPIKWLAEFTGENGPMVDVTRKYHPKRADMNTCWNTKLGGRATNYGCRLDYILVTPGLIPWIKGSDIQANVLGSDHCPVYVDFHDEIEIEGRGMVKLWDEMNPGRTQDDLIPPPPPFAARYYEEFSASQKKLSSFFGKGAEIDSPRASGSTETSSSSTASTSTLPTPSAPISSLRTSSIEESLARMKSSTRPEESVKSKAKGKAKESSTGQKTLASFFAPPKAESKTKAKKSKKEIKKSPSPLPFPATPPASFDQNPSTQEIASALDEANATAISSWGDIFTKQIVPNCTSHNEPAKLWTVNKSGINKGRKFWMCARPVGPGYDQGQAKLHVDPLYRCGYFEFVTNVKRPVGVALDSKAKKARTA